MKETLKKIIPQPVIKARQDVLTRVRSIVNSFNMNKYTLQCPSCGFYIPAYKPVGEFFTKNMEENGFPYKISEFETLNHEAYACPNCNTSDRDRMYILFFEKFVDKNKQINLVDFAPTGVSRYLKKQPYINYRSADLMNPNADDQVDITSMPIYEDGRFDVFICSHVLEHVSDDIKAMKELYRILKPGGWGIAMVPIMNSIDEVEEDPSVEDEKERWKRFGQYDHVRLYNRKGFTSRLESCNFEIETYTIEQFGASSIEEYGLDPNSILYIVKKPR